MPYSILMESALTAMDDAVGECRGRRPRGIRETEALARCVIFPELARRFPEIPERSRRTAGLMCLLGPRGGGPPPAILHHELDLLLERMQRATRRGRVPWEELEIQIAVAYACGWNRRARCVDQPLWDLSHWPEAVGMLVPFAESQIRWTLGLLRSDVHGFPNVVELDIPSLARYCVGVYTGTRPITDQAYRHRQSICNWNPLIGSLFGCFARAIDGFGLRKGTLKVNQFRNGILYPALHEEGILDIGRAAFQVCPGCGIRAEYGTTGLCRACGHHDPQRPWRIVATQRLIHPSIYTTVPFRKCRTAKCGTHVRGADARCPHCEGRLSAKPTQLLVQQHLFDMNEENPFAMVIGLVTLDI